MKFLSMMLVNVCVVVSVNSYLHGHLSNMCVPVFVYVKKALLKEMKDISETWTAASEGGLRIHLDTVRLFIFCFCLFSVCVCMKNTSTA